MFVPTVRLTRLLACLLSLLIHGVADADCRTGATVTLLHFNDFHGQLEPDTDAASATGHPVGLGGLARLAATVARVRAENPDRPVLLLFAGDLLQGTVSSSLFLGIPDVILFNRMGVDAAVMGNHEFDYGQDVFRRLAGQADFPFLSANIQTHPEPLPVQPSLVIDRPDSPTVALLGLTTPELTTATHPRNAVGVSVEDPVTVARRLVPELREQADLVVVLSHLGLTDDRRLAQAIPEIDLIVGGHNHFVLEQPVLEGDVVIVQAGERGHWLGRLDLACREGRLERTAYRLLPMDASVPEDPEMATEVARIVAEAESGLAEEIGMAAVDLSARREDIRRGEAVFGNLMADLAREVTLADVALFNAGGFRASIPAGPVTLKQVYQAFPFRNELVVGQLTGAQLIAALQRSAAFDPEDNPGGLLQVSGLRYVIADRRLASASLQDGPIDPERLYQVVMPDFLAAGGDGYAMLTEMTAPVMTGRLISDLLIDAIRHGKTIAPVLDGRIRRGSP
ncbi:5'-nucleotidase/2',3'-cyclic phosphodiesterase-like hydrolase [Thiocystis violascens DSM 198]|uniref:5'-nucleotidase/2',3'-cyclic phosphodiesterase-like hydrolase n=1 Tax=Thiocystis violascens (strain ATCC 17096 / DSM 198 / 6111) TaxID=765911 RepID=I3YA51_THIV6|nr:5'-nucleotidase/2',3'-cyclic phosphodiesterase-like hydrolase [Thiocystis violascens DSM 198]